jgi:hypothetical protein
MERAPLTHRHTRGVATLLVALLGVLALTLTVFANPVAAKPAKQPPGASNAAAPARTVNVMTRNLYLGAELNDIVAAFASGNFNQLVLAATSTWEQVVESDPAERMAAVADEIVATKPHAVGLQEVTKYTTYDFNAAAPENERATNPTVAYDLLDLLLEALRGMSYREVSGATAENFSSDPIPYLVNGAPTKAVQLLDRDVIIVRDGVKATNARNGNFDAVLQPPAFPIRVDRGWGSADIRANKARFRFVNSHTEAFGGEGIRVAEVQELLAAQAAVEPPRRALPIIYAGDFNSQAPSAQAYQTLLAAGLHDLWVEAPSKPAEGNTCCQDADLSNQVSNLTTRIDLLLGSAKVRALSADRVGDQPVDLPGETWWASDHAGVVATVVIPRR